MAPDLNAVSAGEKFDYSAPGASGYDIPDVTLNDITGRRMRVLCVGGGVSGILMAYQIQKYCQNVDFKIFEKNPTIGGTWLENRYPNAACDIPSHAYTYNFALNPDWPRFFSYSPDIWEYLDKVCDVFGLRKYINFNTQCVGAFWDDDKGEWLVKLREIETLENGDKRETRSFEERCDVFLHATGLLNRWKWPEIKGLHDFKGKVVHTANWPSDYQKEQWKNDRVAVIGSGSSSIQTVPGMQPHARHLDVFVRTGVWFTSIAGNLGANSEYTQQEKETFRRDPEKLVEHGKFIEDQINGLWGSFYSDTPAAEFAKDIFAKRMAEWIKDERLLKGFTPTFGVGCRRVTPGDPYMEAIQKPNVDVHFTAVESVTGKGVVGADGVERECDTIVCATGFDVTYKPHFPLVGKNGLDLREKWKLVPECYLGVTIPDFPNLFTFIGPTWPVENGSIMGPLLSVSEYAIQMIKKLQRENIKSMTPRQDVTDAFNDHTQEWIKHTVWKDSCRSWYRNNETGRVNAVWPGSSLHYQLAIKHPRYEDYDIVYHNKHNMWAFLGMGWTEENRISFALAGEIGALEAQGASAEQIEEKKKEAAANWKDVSPYMNIRYMDPRWLAASGMSYETAKETVIKATAEKAAERVRTEIERAERGEGGNAANTSGFDATVL